MSGLLFGLAPAMQLVRQRQLGQACRGRRRWSQDLFVAAEVCGAFVLIVMTTLLLRSLWAIERIEPGFDPQRVTTAFFLKPQNDPGFFDRLQSTLQASPGVQSAALANPIPFADSGVISGFAIRNRQEQRRVGKCGRVSDHARVFPDAAHSVPARSQPRGVRHGRVSVGAA